MLANEVLSWLIRGSTLLVVGYFLARIIERRSAKPMRSVTAASGLVLFGIAVATAMPIAPPDGQGPSETTGDDAMRRVSLSQEPTPESPTLSVSGRIVEEETGQPLASAEVVLRAKIEGQEWAGATAHPRDVLARTRTGASGRFAFVDIGIPIRATPVLRKRRRGEGGIELIAFAEKKGVKWTELDSFQTAGIELRLERQAELAGVVSDSEGKPVADASLSVAGLSAGKSDLDAFLGDPGDLSLYSELGFGATTDADGKFELAHMPRDYRLMVRCQGPSGEWGSMLVDTAEHEFQTLTIRNLGKGGKAYEVHRNPLRLQTEQRPWIEVRVVDHRGEPVRGGSIGASDASRRYGGRADVDDEGTALLIVKHDGLHDIHYVADPLNPRVGTRVRADIQTERQEPLEIRLLPSRVIPGKVVDADTGDPIIGAYVQAESSMAVSGSDGTFHIPLPLGGSSLRLRHAIDGYYVPHRYPGYVRPADTVEVIVNETGPVETEVLKVARGLLIQGELRNERGEPVSGAVVTATSDRRSNFSVETRSDETGRFLVSGLAPGLPTRVVAMTESVAAETVIDATLNYPPDQTLVRKVKLVLRPGVTLTGRVVDDGKPTPDVTMKLFKTPPIKPGHASLPARFFGETRTDAEGRYRIPGLKKGEQYRFEVIAPGDRQVHDWRHQSPVLTTIDTDDDATVELPDAVLVRSDQVLRGVVVDPDGNPLAGVQVSASLASGGRRPLAQRGTVPWTETDDQGRFTMTNLPNKPIRLMAYRRAPADGRIRYRATVEPELNADEIRIFLDPDRGSGIGDLE